MVWALSDNDSACSFYLSLGGKPIAEGAERFGDISLRKSRLRLELILASC